MLAFFTRIGYTSSVPDTRVHPVPSPRPVASRVFDSLLVRPIVPAERAEWEALMARHHYLGFRTLVGEAMQYVALLEGHWVALLGWGAAAFKNRHRDAWIGWHPALQWQRLPWVANNGRFLMLPACHRPNLASKVLAVNLHRLSADWQAAWGHPILLAETFVDPTRFRGTCYRAAGWIPLGETRGFGRNGGRYYPHGQPKRIFVRPLCPQAARVLADPCPHPALQQPEVRMKVHALKLEQPGGLLDSLHAVPDPRRRRGIRHRPRALLAVAICAVLSGAKSFAAMGEWAARASQPMLRRLGCRRDPRTQRYRAPSEPTLRRLLQAIDAQAVDQAVSAWLLAQVRGTAPPPAASAVAIDGKTLRGSGGAAGKPVHVLSAFLQHQGVVVAQHAVAPTSNECTAVQPLLAPLELRGALVTADALHTRKELATFLVEDKGADYLFTVKDNQPTLKADIAALQLETFPPSAPDR